MPLYRGGVAYDGPSTLGHGSHPKPAPAVASVSRELVAVSRELLCRQQGDGLTLVRLAALGALDSDERKAAQVRLRLSGATLRVSVAVSAKGGGGGSTARGRRCGAGCHAARCASGAPRVSECRPAHWQGRVGSGRAAAGDRAGARPWSAGGEHAGAIRTDAAPAWRWLRSEHVRRAWLHRGGGAGAADESREARGGGGAPGCPLHCARARGGGRSRRPREGSDGPSV